MELVRKLKFACLRAAGVVRERPAAFFHHLKSRSPRQVLSLVLLLTGVGLIGYVGSQYWEMYHTQRTLEAQWEHQQLVAVPASTHSARQFDGDDLLVKVSIPKIKLEAIVVEGASRRELSIGPGHVKQTAMPGEPGNAVITAHRDTFFRHIYELQKGDQILVRRNGQVFTFEVTGKKIVEPEDVSVLKQTADSRLTLITCYPTYYIGPAPQRLVVFSRLLENGPQTQTEKKEQAVAAHSAQ